VVADFKAVKIGPRGKMIFEGVNMHRVSLLLTDLSRVEFRDVRWREHEGAFVLVDQVKLLIATNERFANRYYKWARDLIHYTSPLSLITKLKARLLGHVTAKQTLSALFRILRLLLRKYHEYFRRKENWKRRVRENLDPDITLDNVLQELRDLRDWYERRMRYEEGGKFFISEMDTRRLVGQKTGLCAYLSTRRLGGLRRWLSFELEQLIITLYRWLCLYGESMTRPLAGLLLTWLFFGLLYALCPPSILKDLPGLLSSPHGALLSLYKGLELSLSALLQMPPATSEASVVAERGLSVLLMGSLLTALKRRLERRVRR